MLRLPWKILVWLFRKFKRKPKVSPSRRKSGINDLLPEGWFGLSTGKESVVTDGVFMIHCKKDGKMEVTKNGIVVCNGQWVDGLKIKHKEARE